MLRRPAICSSLRLRTTAQEYVLEADGADSGAALRLQRSQTDEVTVTQLPHTFASYTHLLHTFAICIRKPDHSANFTRPQHNLTSFIHRPHSFAESAQSLHTFQGFASLTRPAYKLTSFTLLPHTLTKLAWLPHMLASFTQPP